MKNCRVRAPVGAPLKIVKGHPANQRIRRTAFTHVHDSGEVADDFDYPDRFASWQPAVADDQIPGCNPVVLGAFAHAALDFGFQ